MPWRVVCIKPEGLLPSFSHAASERLSVFRKLLLFIGITQLFLASNRTTNRSSIMANEVQNVALAGATGNLGKYVLKHLLSSSKQLNLTVLTRPGSSIRKDLPVAIKEVDYESHESLISALTGIDALVIVLNFESIPDTEYKLVEAAAVTGVKWIIPTEFGGDNANEEIQNLPINAMKTGVRERIEKLGMKWTGLITGPWLDWVSPRTN